MSTPSTPPPSGPPPGQGFNYQVPKKPFYKKPVGIIAIAVAILVVIAIIASAAGAGDDKAKADKPKSTSSAAAKSKPTEAAYDYATATPGAQWREYQRLLAERGVDASVRELTEDEAYENSQGLCQNGNGEWDDYVDLMYTVLYEDDQDSIDTTQADIEAQLDAYCPTQTPNATAAFDGYTPTAAAPKAKDIVVKIKVRSQECFGSAGCNVTFQIDPTYVGPDSMSEGSWAVTYKVLGGDDPLVNTFTVEEGQASFDEEESIGTPSSSSKLTAKVIRVEAN